MRITRRTGGGRGDYEISETAGSLSPYDLVDHRIRIHLGDSLSLDTGVTLRFRNGKFRLRMENAELHVPRQVAAALLMPHPVRANPALKHGTPILRRNGYTIQHITFRPDVKLEGSWAYATIEEIIIRNADNLDEHIVACNRVGSLVSVWQRQDEFPEPISSLLKDHQSAVTNGGPLPLQAEQSVRQLEDVVFTQSDDLGSNYVAGGDVLDALAALLRDADQSPPPPPEPEQPETLEIKRRSTEKWKRWASSRGPRSARFRQNVRKAYRSRCIVCGSTFPITSYNVLPGVDAAHILPWAKYDLDKVCNGICLCRTHHWAFDEGLIEIAYSDGTYLVAVSSDAVAQIRAEAPEFDLEALMKYAGPIPDGWLPLSPSDRPRPELLERLKSEG